MTFKCCISTEYIRIPFNWSPPSSPPPPEKAKYKYKEMQ